MKIFFLTKVDGQWSNSENLKMFTTMLKTFLKNIRQKWLKVGKNALILQTEKYEM